MQIETADQLNQIRNTVESLRRKLQTHLDQTPDIDHCAHILKCVDEIEEREKTEVDYDPNEEDAA